MTFYLKPPSGKLPLETLHQFALLRLKFLLRVAKAEDNVKEFQAIVQDCMQFVEDSDCLIEGTVRDRASHFILRLASLSHRNLKSFIMESETQLFKLRLYCLQELEIWKSVVDLRRHILLALSAHETLPSRTRDFMSVLLYICDTILNRKLISHVYKRIHSETCEEETLEVPFTYVPSLVAERKVHLHHGVAKVSCPYFPHLMCCLFRQLLQNGLQHMEDIGLYTEAYRDTRMLAVFQEITTYLQTHLNSEGYVGSLDPVLAADVNSLSRTFPPCMKHLQHTLRRRHRLNHTARLQYTLFLKEIGMPLNEAMKFWELEYSKSSGPSEGGCCHLWNNDKKRYIYSIRHLYGLEGQKTNYRAHCCTSLQANSLSIHDEGGCPFVHFDNKKLTSLLTDDEEMNAQHISEVLELKQNHSPQHACQMYFLQKYRFVRKMKEEQGTCTPKPHIPSSAKAKLLGYMSAIRSNSRHVRTTDDKITTCIQCAEGCHEHSNKVDNTINPLSLKHKNNLHCIQIFASPCEGNQDESSLEIQRINYSWPYKENQDKGDSEICHVKYIKPSAYYFSSRYNCQL